MNIAIHFEIPVQDLERAIRFYEGVFETVLERVQIDGNEMALFPLEGGTAGCSGALARALASGGACLYPVTRVGESLRVAECRDCEGNRIALQEGT